MTRRSWIVWVVAGAGTLVLVALILSHSPPTTIGYRPNDDVRDRFAQLDMQSVDRVTVDGFVLAYGETRDVIAALRRSERRVSPGEGRPYRTDDREGSKVSVERASRSEGPRSIVVRFAYDDPARHHGPAFARVVAPVLRRTSYKAQTAGAR